MPNPDLWNGRFAPFKCRPAREAKSRTRSATDRASQSIGYVLAKLKETEQEAKSALYEANLRAAAFQGRIATEAVCKRL